MKAPKQPKKVDSLYQDSLKVKRSNQKTTRKPHGVTDENSLSQKEQSKLCPTINTLEAKIFGKESNKGNIGEESNKGNTLKNSASESLDSGSSVSKSSKIKLQLFPYDDRTRITLEKDGLCPYLELTLSGRKKISSVLTHIMSKWGHSSVAVGEPWLFSFSNDKTHLPSQRTWTLDNTTTCVLDVYKALESPAIFRLWYGWFSKSPPNSCGTEIPPFVDSHQEVSNSCSNHEDRCADQEDLKKSNAISPVHVVQVASPSENNLSIELNAIQNVEMRTDSNGGKPLFWDDCWTNISIGGLLSEVSLQGRFSTNSKPHASISKSKQGTFDLNDSAAHDPSAHHILPSILDAEDTCSPFSFRKIFSSSNNAQAVDHTIDPKSNASSVAQVTAQGGYSREKGCQESKADSFVFSGVYNDDRSLGLRGIKWTDSLGPFDLIVPPSGNTLHGACLSSNGVFGCNCSFCCS